jgi:hypothetical protein
MKTRKTFIAAAIVAVMACSAANAQVLGGNVGGAVNGALGGGLRDSSVFGSGNAAGSFGGELDTGSTLRKTRGMTDETTRRARDVGANARNRTKSTVATAHDTSANVASSSVAAAHSVKDQQMRNTTAVAGSTASQLDATSLSAATEGAASHSTAIEPQQDVAPSLGSITGEASGSAAGSASASRHGVVADAMADGNAATSLTGKKTVAAQPQETPVNDDVPAADRNDKR